MMRALLFVLPLLLAFTANAQEADEPCSQPTYKQLLKLREAHPAVAGFDELGLDALHLDHFTHQGQFDRLGFASADYRKTARALRPAAHPLDRFVEHVDLCSG